MYHPADGVDRHLLWRTKGLVVGPIALAALTLSLLMGAVVPTNAPAAAEPTGTLWPSMVRTLDDDDGGSYSAIDLDRLRRDVLGSYYSGPDGTGVDVAVIDTGVAPVDGLDGIDKVLHGPDLSFEAASPDAAYLDTYGHGTHMAGIIAGDRVGQQGIAPGARIVSLKVAGHDGITTVPQVIAAIDWVVEHHNTAGLNIRVLNLSLGQADVTAHQGDLLSAAVERAWNAGIFVVVAAGNDGDTQAHLDSPAIDPYVIAVGASAGLGEIEEDRRVPNWSGQGNGIRNPDVVAPGRSIASYRVPGSTIDEATPTARYGDDLFKGSGTSQAAAVVSGVAAALISDHPELTPDQIKATLQHRAERMEDISSRKQGDGHIRGRYTITYSPVTYGAEQIHEPADNPTTTEIGTPDIDTNESVEDPAELTDPDPTDADPIEPADPTDSGATWSGGTWSGATWSGATWSGATWSGATWSGATWSGATWSGATWSGATWSGGTWSGATWSGATWSGATWSGGTWSSNGWE